MTENNRISRRMNQKQALKHILSYVEGTFGTEIGTKSREHEIVLQRALYFKLALDTSKSSMSLIGKLVNRDHATVIHAKNNLFQEVMSDSVYSKAYHSYLSSLKPSTQSDYTDLVNGLLAKVEQVNEINAVLNTLLNKEAEELTDNEVMYRNLNEEQRRIYDERAALVLKTFRWKTKNKYEQINCNS